MEKKGRKSIGVSVHTHIYAEFDKLFGYALKGFYSKKS